MSDVLPNIKEVNVEGKTIFLRADLDVPLSKIRTIEDDTRLKTGLPTIKYLLTHGAKVIISGHLDRPKGVDKRLSLEPIAVWLRQNIKYQISNIKYIKIGEFDGWEITPSLFLLENLRFFKEEEESEPQFAQKLASLANIYVNDAFSVAHRAHASTVGVAKLLPHYAGLRLQEEVKVLSSVIENPKRPLVVVIGGAKLETKLPLVEKMHQIADYVLVGGKIAKEKGELLKVQHEKLQKKQSILLVADQNLDGSDITPTSVENFMQVINTAKTIVWNGPLGIIGSKETERGTRKLAEGIVKTSTYTVVGGGDTLEFLRRENLEDKFSFTSTGGGAMLAFLSGQPLPALEVLTEHIGR